MDDNLISFCYVIENRIAGYVRPTIYLHRQSIDKHAEKLHGFHTVFQAKNFIRQVMGYGVVLEISKDKPEIKETQSFLSFVRFFE